MTMEVMNVRVECWPTAADEYGIWLVSGDDAWRTPPIGADTEPHAELELMLASHESDQPALIHSTSWRAEGPAVVLTYIAVLPCSDLVRARWPDALPVSLGLLPEVGNPPPHGPTEVPMPRHIDVLHHALRHLVFLRQTDAGARSALTGHWADHLAQMEPSLAGMYCGQ